MKLNRLQITMTLAGMLATSPGLADVNTNKDANPDDWNKTVRLTPMNSKQDTNVSTLDKSNQLRCWQHGVLVVLENNWKPVDPGKGRLMSKGSKRLHAYDYGETFCIYSGG